MDREVVISTDISQKTGCLDRIWRYIGYDECNYTYIPEGIDLIRKFGSLKDAPYYFRTHFLYCTGNLHHTYKWGSTNIYSEDDHGIVVCDFTTFDRIIETYLQNNAKPFIELGFMPMELVDPKHLPGGSLTAQSYHDYRHIGSACPPKDYEKWYELVRQTVTHCCDKFGEDEVAGWYWELWNEPDIFYWRGTVHEYCKLFDYTEKAVHDACARARLAGPATTGPRAGKYSADFLDLFLDHCKNGVNYCTGKVGTRLDYVTFHVKGGGFGFNPKAAKSVPSIKSFIRQCRLGMEIIKKNGYADLEIVLSEADPDGWAAGGVFDNPNMKFRNSEYYATYVAASYLQLIKLYREMKMQVKPLAWAFMFAGERCFEGTRSFTTQGIDKPVFNLFKMFQQLGEESLQLNSDGFRNILEDSNDFSAGYAPVIDGLSSIDKNGTARILIYSHHDDWDIKEKTSVRLNISSLQPGSLAHVRVDMIDDTLSNTHTAWRTIGSPEYPSPSEKARIKDKEELEAIISQDFAVPESGTIVIEFALKTHAVSLVTVTRR